VTPEHGWLITEISAVHLFCDCGLASKDPEVKKTCFDRARNAHIIVLRSYRRVDLTHSQRVEIRQHIRSAKAKMDTLSSQATGGNSASKPAVGES
jgi:hypothetical protein